LVAHFVQKYARPGAAPKQLAPRTMEALLRYRWPGNVRELENAVERGCVTSRDDFIRPQNLPREVITASERALPIRVDLSRPLEAQVADVVAAFEVRYLRRALRKTHGNLRRTARIAGRSKRAIASMLERYKIDIEEFIAIRHGHCTNAHSI
jgi:DNA-binding NtrC family response regulator